MATLTLRPGRPDDAGTLFSIHRESALVAYARIFPPDRYPFPNAEMSRHWVERFRDAEATTVIAERVGVAIGFAVGLTGMTGEHVRAASRVGPRRGKRAPR